ncbi:hypothetical protein DRQ50_01995 [bacterium]|nr:MAG: hypothetical protein DRQ50_01995 [bacterium]
MKLAIVFLGMLAMAIPGIALAQCSINGNITAAPNADPALPAWEYTLVITWDTGSLNALSHANLLIDPVGGTCSCSDINMALTLENPSGTSDGEGGCTVPYDGFIECDGDPSIPGVTGILLKFEPDEDLGCEPGTTGVATFVFYSEQSPVPVDEDILSLVDKFAGNSCFGNVSGEFPGLACNPVPAKDSSWGRMKGLYQ